MKLKKIGKKQNGNKSVKGKYFAVENAFKLLKNSKE